MTLSCKICGISNSKTLEFLTAHPTPPKMIGFICNWPKSKRFVEHDKLKGFDIRGGRVRLRRHRVRACHANQAVRGPGAERSPGAHGARHVVQRERSAGRHRQ